MENSDLAARLDAQFLLINILIGALQRTHGSALMESARQELSVMRTARLNHSAMSDGEAQRLDRVAVDLLKASSLWDPSMEQL